MSPDRRPLSREPVEVAVDGFTHGGEGVARIEGKAVFVPGTLPGETVVVGVVDDRKRWARAELLEVVDPSPDRVLPPCPYVHPDRERKCGGCDLQHIAPDAQRRLKTRVVREQLERLGKLSDPPVAETRPVGPDAGYRTRARFHAADDGRLGFHQAGTHDVVPIDQCLILADAPQAIRDAVGDDTGAEELVVRGHATTGARAAVLVPGEGGLDLPAGEFDLLLAQPDGSTVAMRGDGLLSEVVAGRTFRFPADAFFQVNTGGAEAIVEEVLAAAGDVEGSLVWDLYAGVGLIALPLAAAGADVVAVEGHHGAARWIEENAAANGLAVEAEAEPVADFVARMIDADDAYELPDVVVLDPPRTGAGLEVCTTIVRAQPGTIVYVACDVGALARDARSLVEAGYRLAGAQPLDLFPHTHHVEVVARFVR